MKSSTIVTVLLATSFLAANGYAADNNTMGTTAAQTGAGSDSVMAANNGAADSQTGNFSQLYTLSSKMLGHVSMANDALSFGLYSEASDNINSAQKEASDLASQTAQFNAANPQRSNNAGNNSKFLVPVMDNTVALRGIEGKRLDSSNPKLDVNNAETVNYKLFLDTKQASEALAQAQSDMGQQKYDDALNALQGVTNGAILEATAYDTPLEAVRDNLMLAREEMRNKQYKSASYALNHAKHELNRAEKADSQLAKNSDVQDLQNQINDTQTALAQDNPSVMQKAENKIGGWIHTVESHMHKQG